MCWKWGGCILWDLCLSEGRCGVLSWGSDLFGVYIGGWVSIGCGLVSISVGVWEFVDGLRLVWDLA